MSGHLLQHVFDFWKPLVDPDELQCRVEDAAPEALSGTGVVILSEEAPPAWYEVLDNGGSLRLWGSVRLIDDIPEGARSIAQVRTLQGEHHSHVLYHPASGRVVLPFSPGECIEALRFERYVPAAHRTVLPQSLLSAYYSVRKFVPVGLKMGLRKVVAKRSEETSHPLGWPADDSQDRLQRLLLRVVMLGLKQETLGFRWFWPDGHPWAVILTHDVETGAGLERVAEVMSLEEERGLRSSFNLVPRDYEVSSDIIARFAERGFEAGVHGYTHDGLMFSKWSTYLERVEKVNSYGRSWGAAGFRSPATYRNLDWFHLLEFEYDSSMTDTAPYEPQPGGCASCFPYMVGSVVEVPMTLPQDHTLYGLLGEGDARIWLEKLALIREGHGMACVLTHPDPGQGYLGNPETEAHYAEVLDCVADSDAWRPLPRELAAWWRARAATDSQEGRWAAEDSAMAALEPDGSLRLRPPGVTPGTSSAR